MFFDSTQLLAYATRMGEISTQYRENGAVVQSRDLWFFCVPVVAISVAFLIYKIADRDPAIVNTPYGLLNELCKAHQIDSTGRQLLTRIAEELDLEQPAVMLLGEAQFEAIVKRADKQINFNRRQNSTLGSLRRRLFK